MFDPTDSTQRILAQMIHSFFNHLMNERLQALIYIVIVYQTQDFNSSGVLAVHYLLNPIDWNDKNSSTIKVHWDSKGRVSLLNHGGEARFHLLVLNLRGRNSR